MRICGDAGPFEFRDYCIRSSWAALVPAAVVLGICIFSLPIRIPGTRKFDFLFKTYLPLNEAEALDATASSGETTSRDEDVGDASLEISDKVPVWRSVLFSFVGVAETLIWLSDGSYRLIANQTDVWSGVRPFIMSASWLYTAIRPITYPTATPPYDLLTIYVAQLVGDVLQLGGLLYDRNVLGLPLPPVAVVLAHSANLALILVLLFVVVGMPLAIPSKGVKRSEIVSFVFFAHCTDPDHE